MEWEPFFLRPDTPPEGLLLPPHIREKIKDPNNPLKKRAASAGLKMVERELIPSTRRAHEAAEFAREKSFEHLEAFNASVLRRYWSDGEDLWQLATLRAAARDAQLDPDELEQAITEGTYRRAVEERVSEAQSIGIQAVPTFLFDHRLALQGAHEYPVFEQVMKRLGRAPRSAK